MSLKLLDVLKRERERERELRELRERKRERESERERETKGGVRERVTKIRTLQKWKKKKICKRIHIQISGHNSIYVRTERENK